MKKTKKWLYVAGLLSMGASCQKEVVTNLDSNTDCFRYGVYHQFSDGKGKIIDGEKTKIPSNDQKWFINYQESEYNPKGKENMTAVCNIQKELMVDGLEISFSGRIPAMPSDPSAKFSPGVVIDTYQITRKP